MRSGSYSSARGVDRLRAYSLSQAFSRSRCRIDFTIDELALSNSKVENPSQDQWPEHRLDAEIFYEGLAARQNTVNGGFPK
jgi:hypothetical protein